MKTGNSSLPKILLGPILRRAEETHMCIWLACDRPVTVKAEIFRSEALKASNHGSNQNSRRAEPIGSGIAKSRRLGEHLHVILAVVRPIKLRRSQNSASEQTCFPSDELLAYDIEVLLDNDSKNTSMRLKDFGLVNGKNSIVYGHNDDVSLPTVFLRGRSTPLNFFHGSCRKLHGKGEDSLVAADEIISSSFSDLKRRPSALFLTGDQIYADDVAFPLSHYLTQLGIKLLGREEEIPGIGKKKLTEIKVGERQRIVQEYAKFTSPSADNHLLTFGEFAAMYLLAWNVENWPERFPDITTIPRKNQKKYREQVKQLEKTRKDLPLVRRVLANIPTYMIFDDHEITDDWNITREWHENVKGSKCGKQVVANGLAAYWAFQGWGNDPALYSEEFIGKISEYLGKNGSVSEAERVAFEDLLWTFHGWTFSAPTNPLTIVSDCRTQRHYDSYDGPPQLLSSKGLLSILQTAKQANYRKGDPIIIVCPTPVFGFLLMEEVQKAVAKIIRVYKLDLETWFANQSGLFSFLSFLIETLRPRHCIFLSGDVHYGFTISAAFALLQKKHVEEEEEDLCMSISQLNSSALKTTSLVKIAFVSEIMGHIRQLFPWKQEVQVGWINDDESKHQLLSKTMRVKSKPTLHLHLQQRTKEDKSELQQPPDWIEARSIVKASGSIISPLIISDNNIGLVSIDGDRNRIIHNFLVRKQTRKEMKVHQTIIEMDRYGKNKLEELVKAKMNEIGHK
ncbi:MAG TPA: hypothetical protein VFS97_09590 [Nitrososphaeraceae archaeon]|nr:hypothetical protein [Nitrososphaeraceae archaeon]